MRLAELRGAATPASARIGWAMVARGFLCQNVAIGCAFGAAGVTLLPLQARYHVGRAEVALGLSLVVLMSGLLGPLVAAFIARIGLRRTMGLGLLLSAAGYVALAFASSMPLALAAFGVLVGPGVALFGALPASLLASGWIKHRRALAVGLVNVPLLAVLVPLVGLALIPRYGLPGFFLALAAIHLVIVPVVLGIADPPHEATGAPAQARAAGQMPRPRLLSRPEFWIIAVGGGVLSAAGVIACSHIVALAIERGVSSARAAELASLIGVASIAGSLLVGPLSDRIGAAGTLVVSAFGLAASWTALFFAASFVAMASSLLMAGACAAAVYPAVNLLSVDRYGLASAARALGLFGLINRPFVFLLPPAAGALHDTAGSYDPVILAIIAACVATAVVFAATGRLRTAAASSPNAFPSRGS